MTASEAQNRVAEWITTARGLRAASVAALGVTMRALDLETLEIALSVATLGDPGRRDLEIVEVVEWTSLDEVNAAVGSGSAAVLAAGYRDGTPHFVVGRFRADLARDVVP